MPIGTSLLKNELKSKSWKTAQKELQGYSRLQLFKTY